MKKPVVLCIMDGYGINDSEYGNAISMAKKPNLDKNARKAYLFKIWFCLPDQ